MRARAVRGVIVVLAAGDATVLIAMGRIINIAIGGCCLVAARTTAVRSGILLRVVNQSLQAGG